MSRNSSEVTVLLRAWADGDREAGDQLFPMIYGELRQISQAQLNRSSAHLTLQATEVLHEAYLRLADQHAADWKDRAHFFALAATVVRRVLLDHARYRLAERRDRRVEVEFEPDHAVARMSRERADELIQLHDALNALAEIEPRRAKVVELRYFAGLDVKGAAEVMDTSPATVKRDWAFARAWLRRRIDAPADGPLAEGDA